MKFRILCWVTEYVGRDGKSQLGGVFTSIHDLIERGLGSHSDSTGLRVSLVKLDSNKSPLGHWESPDFSGMQEALQEYVETDELNAQECEQLVADLCRFAKAS